MPSRLDVAIEAAHRAARLTLGYFQSGFTVDMKGDATPVTAADRAAERLVRDFLHEIMPGEPVFGEEEGGEASIPDRWVIDPIDGTKSFLSGVPLYSTLLSYEIDFQPVIAVCVFPALNEMLYAEMSKGAFWNGRRAQVSNRRSLDGAVLCCAGHKGMEEQGRTAGMLKLARQTMATRTWSDAYGHALVATGRVEAMIDPVVSHWDVSAMHLIVNEAGGKSTRFDGGPTLTPVEPGGNLQFVATNGWIHDEVLAAFQV